MKKLLLGLLLALSTCAPGFSQQKWLSILPPAPTHNFFYTPQTWYIRTDGGTATQCTGHTNAAYPGTGTAQPCALNHPFWLKKTGQFTATWRDDYVGGDTVQFEDAGPYYIGQGSAGLGFDWSGNGFFECGGSLPASGCTFPTTPPLGSSGAHTKWLGYCVALGTGCHQSDGSNVKNSTVLSAAAGPFYMFSIQGAQWFDMQGFTITQPDSCTAGGDGGSNITQTSKTGTVGTYTFTAGGGLQPIPGLWVIIAGTTNGSGIFNGLKQIATVSGSTFTVNGFASGTITAAAESGTESTKRGCEDPSSAHYANHGIQIEYLTAQGPSNTTLSDIDVHGMTAQGFLGSHINQSSGDTFTASYIFVRGNGMAGWDSDGGGCGTSCETVGTFTLDHARIEFNGCVPVNTSSAPNATTGTAEDGYQYCFAQSTGGYGDGLSFIAAGAGTFNFTNSYARWNTQDSFDLLHLGDDQTHTQTLNVENNWAEGSMGQMYKVGGGANVQAWDNFADNNCHVMPIGTSFPMTLNPTGWNAGLQSDSCRAAGDNWLISLNNGRTSSLIHNTTVGYGATTYDVICASTCTGSEVMIFQDNITKGFGDPWNSGTLPGGLFINATEDPFANAGSAINHNLWDTMRSGTCPQNAHETNTVCSDPLLTAESDVDAIVPTLTSLSPARFAGVTAGPTLDFYGMTFLSPPSIGFAEFGGSFPTAQGPTLSPGDGYSGPATTVALTTGTTACSAYIAYNTTGMTSGGDLTGVTVSNSYSLTATGDLYAQVQGCPGYLNSPITHGHYTVVAPASANASVGGTVPIMGTVTVK